MKKAAAIKYKKQSELAGKKEKNERKCETLKWRKERYLRKKRQNKRDISKARCFQVFLCSNHSSNGTEPQTSTLQVFSQCFLL